jgi:hypothetical protein
MLKPALFVVIALVTAGCATTVQTPDFNVGVNAFARPDGGKTGTYILLPAEDGVGIDDLQFLEFSTYVERALSTHGFQKAEGFDSADLAIFVAYGIGDPAEHTYSYNLPVWGQTGVASSRTTGNVNVSGNAATYSETTTNTPQYGVKGYTSQVGTYTTFTRHAFFTAYDLSQFRLNGTEKVVWETRIASTGSSGDLRRVFPVLVAAGAPYIATSTGQIIDVTLKETDQSVLEVKGLAIDAASAQKK